MNKGLKIILIIIAGVVTIIIGALYVTLYTIREAYGSDCENSRQWTVNTYTIQEEKCLGWAGPHYYPLSLIENGTAIANNGHQIDSCIIRFIPDNDLYIELNICSKQVTELRPKKIALPSSIDSIIMYNTKLKQSKKLTKEAESVFVHQWNKAQVHDFRDNNNPFYPNTLYVIKVFSKTKVRKFETGNFMIKDEDHWSYNFLEGDEDTSVKKFDEFWNEINTSPRQQEPESFKAFKNL